MAEEEEKYTLEQLQEKLTEKERIFCHQYIIDWNGARSAREAGYSEDSAKEIAHATLTKVHNQQYINFIKNDLEKEAGISKLSQVNGLIKILKDEESGPRDIIAATSELNKMMGYNEAEKISLLGGINTLNLVKASESSGTSQD